jgi:hypothetical protein
MSAEHKNIFTELKRLRINPNQLPDNMPEDLKEAIEATKSMHFDWDPEDEDTPEIIEAKKQLKETVEATIKLVKDWLNQGELQIEASQEKKVLLFIQSLDEAADNDKLRLPGSNDFYVKPFNLVAAKLVENEEEFGKVKFGPYTFTREKYRNFWTCKKAN